MLSQNVQIPCSVIYAQVMPAYIAVWKAATPFASRIAFEKQMDRLLCKYPTHCAIINHTLECVQAGILPPSLIRFIQREITNDPDKLTFGDWHIPLEDWQDDFDSRTLLLHFNLVDHP